MMTFAEDQPLEAEYGLIIQVNECAPAANVETSRCELAWEIEVFGALDWHENALGGVSVTQKRVLATPHLLAQRGSSVSFEIGSVLEGDTPLQVISGEFLVRAEQGAP